METCKCSKEAEIATIKSEIKTLFKGVDKNKLEIKELSLVHELIKDLTISVSVMAEQMKRNTEELGVVKIDLKEIKTKDIGSIKNDVEEIKRKPAGDYEYYKRLFIGGVITAVLGFMIGKLL